MISLLTAFFVSFIATILIIRTQKLHGGFSGDHDLAGPQKFHMGPVPRIGGVAIGLGLFFAIALRYEEDVSNFTELLLLFCAIPAFSIGVAEDITKKVSVRTRLMFTAFGALLACLFLNVQIQSLDIPGLDYVFALPAVAILFTIFAVTGLANAFNIIDGFNGLSSMVGIISLLGLSYIGFKFNDPMILSMSLIMAGAILGFFIWNYPRGLIFLGDGGAYLIGFWIAIMSILAVSRHGEISPWFALMLNAYPILETVFTIYRRKFHQGKSPGHPDGIHFHSLIFRRILNKTHITSESDWFSANARTSPYLWVLSSLAVVPAILFYNSTAILIGCLLIFIIAYVWLYKQIVTFRTPQWMHPQS
ncbi:MraY family glycosyltransferase [Polynucleobacter arcticus]|uniref:Glycosyl transferase n=1 Tax=Polynucleobacter arcticus TaxID=1743165 RepID=A0A6M9PIT1_9BURK|nr:glycosyltransferase [Polynucleobacter arcticus]QKM59862.1 glycosyl transferase [Polynucleobacter arcticus]